MWTFIVVFVLLTAGHRALEFDNSLRGILRYICPDKQVVSLIRSYYSPIEEDRQWKIECRELGVTSNCSWSGFHYLYERELSYNCPVNYVVAGVVSEYNRAHGDRSWNFLCCSAPNLTTFECRDTPMYNYWNENFDFYLPGGHFLTGVQTSFKSHNRDHRWSFHYCKGTTQETQTVSSQIIAANQPVIDLLIEGDVVDSDARNARKCKNCKWPKLQEMVQVPYVVSDSFTTSEKSTIENAIHCFHVSTCVRFVPRKDQADYISIVKLNGCWSHVGKIGRSQQMSLGAGCIQNGIIQHELIHALGFWHEQSRDDRNIYIRINYENIIDGRQHNFEQKETNNLNVPYDYSSVMHYGRTAFSKNNKDTLTPLIPAQIGQRVGMSQNDILKINTLYGCKKYLHKYGEWDNELNSILSRACPFGQAVSGITSLHNVEKKDRLWAISCKAFKKSKACRWSGLENEYWGDMDFKCGANEVIAGVYSEYSSLFQDRRWRFYCCGAPDFSLSNCLKTPDVNFFEEYFSWTVASDHFITGVKSTFDDKARDRRWSFSYCQGNAQ